MHPIFFFVSPGGIIFGAKQEKTWGVSSNFLFPVILSPSKECRQVVISIIADCRWWSFVYF